MLKHHNYTYSYYIFAVSSITFNACLKQKGLKADPAVLQNVGGKATQ